MNDLSPWNTSMSRLETAGIPSESRKLAAIMFTDMVGYSALTQENESLALELLEEHRKLVRPIFSDYGGREVETVGDAFFVEFASALDAARCAVQIQRVLFQRNAALEPERHIRLRIGLHLGDVVHRDKHVHGDGVNIAARIEPLARPLGVCLSEDVARQIRNKIDLPLFKLGKGELKNIQLPVDIYRVVMPWEKRQLPLTDRVSFILRSRRIRTAVVPAALLLGALAYYMLSPSTSIPTGRRSIAVLPFRNLSEEAGSEYFSDRITEDIITHISKIRDLKVISRTSIMQYKNSDKSVRDIGNELSVATILEGSVRPQGKQPGEDCCSAD